MNAMTVACETKPHRWVSRQKMVPEQITMDKSYIDSLKKNREELAAKKAEVLVFYE